MLPSHVHWKSWPRSTQFWLRFFSLKLIFWDTLWFVSTESSATTEHCVLPSIFDIWSAWCEFDQAGEENWYQMNLKDGTKTRFLCDTNSTFLWICVIWWFYSRLVQMSKLPNNSHYNWLEMAINATITDIVECVWYKNTAPPHDVSLLILINIICRQRSIILLSQEKLTKNLNFQKRWVHSP